VLSLDVEVLWHASALDEREAIANPDERLAIQNVVEKLEAMGIRLGYPHSSDVRGTKRSKHGKKMTLRELRPRRGRSPWRLLYRRIGDTMVVAAVAPDGEDDPAGYDDAIVRAQERLAVLEGEL
jgi:hypothetical protein